MLALVAAALGALLARVALTRLRGALVLPAWSELGLDARVLLFALAVALLAALAAGLGPAWNATRPDSHSLLKTVGRGGDAIGFGRLSGALIVTELSLSVALLGVAALFARGMLEFGRAGVVLPAGDPGSATAQPIAGSRVARSVLTALLVPRSVAGSTAPQTAAFTTPTILYLVDRRPPRP